MKTIVICSAATSSPTVMKVLPRYNRPMKVTEILIGLEQDGYQWTAKNPKQTLYVRVGKLAGVTPDR